MQGAEMELNATRAALEAAQQAAAANNYVCQGSASDSAASSDSQVLVSRQSAQLAKMPAHTSSLESDNHSLRKTFVGIEASFLHFRYRGIER